MLCLEVESCGCSCLVGVDDVDAHVLFVGEGCHELMECLCCMIGVFDYVI